MSGVKSLCDNMVKVSILFDKNKPPENLITYQVDSIAKVSYKTSKDNVPKPVKIKRSTPIPRRNFIFLGLFCDKRYPVSVIFTLILLTLLLVLLTNLVCFLKCTLLNLDTPSIWRDLGTICFSKDNPLKSENDGETLKAGTIVFQDKCYNITDSNQFDCIPQGPASESECISRGCCWKNGPTLSPQCFYPAQFRSYILTDVSKTDTGTVAYMNITIKSPYPRNIPFLKIDFNHRTEDILQIKIYDPSENRFEPPFPELPRMEPIAGKKTKYTVDINKEKSGFRVIRKSNNKTIFDAQDVGGFIFSDQLLQFSALLPSSHIYGLGQQRNNFLLDMDWKKITLFNHGNRPKNDANLYGSHPFYLLMEDGGRSNGVLLLNSNAMDIVLTPAPSITYRTIGGVLNFFFFLGPSPADVLRQYTALVGRPFLPPYWSLGFHLCRFGYKTLDNTIKIWNRTRAAGIPLDTQWNDLDYMENGNDFTLDKVRFKELPEFVELLHKKGMHYMVITDPGISSGELPGHYPPFDQGIAQRVFVSDMSGYRPFEGKVWNRKGTVFVDFFRPAAVSYWMQMLRELHNTFPFDGAWIDMNDPENYLNGTKTGCPNTTLDNPPYLPGVVGDKLYAKTLCMSAKHRDGESHYNMHNVYGLAEALVTSFSMQQIRGKRAFVISRSSFPGHGRYAGVWTGDIASTWDDMAHSINDIMSFSLFGIPMSGADICGFSGNTTFELCLRWTQLGAFYPFARNHNDGDTIDQDPVAMGAAVAATARKFLLIRYSLLPYLYTLFWHAHNRGDTVARPMFVEFPNDNATYDVHSQFMWGPGLLIAPVLEQGAVEVKVYLPAGPWYDFFSYRAIVSLVGNSYILPAPLDTFPLLLRGGCIVPTQRPAVTTTLSRPNAIDLLVALDSEKMAFGDLYWDNGDSLDHNDKIYNLVNFKVINKKLKSDVRRWLYSGGTPMLGDVKILGVNEDVHKVFLDGKEVKYEHWIDQQVLFVKDAHLDLSNDFEMTWN